MFRFVRKYRKINEDNRKLVVTNQEWIPDHQADLECEEAIIEDRRRFGRVRTHLMRHLRQKYGSKTANRAMWRVGKRGSRDSRV